MAKRTKRNNKVIHYYDKPIKSITPIHDRQAIRMYNMAIFVTGIIAIGLAFIIIVDLIICAAQSRWESAGESLLLSICALLFIVALLIDIIFTINLNRYVKDKYWLFLYVPAFILMTVFSIPQILNMVDPFLNIGELVPWQIISFVFCVLFVIAEVVRIIYRMILNRQTRFELEKEIISVIK